MELEILIEWAKGSEERYAFQGGRLALVKRDRPAPVNYGFVPDLINPADGEEVDAVLLGRPLPPGSRAKGRLLGLLHLADREHKLVLGDRLEGVEGLLEWFPPERAPRLLGEEAARAFLAERLQERNRYLGALLGLAVGDALGAQVEGLAPGSFPKVRGMRGGGPHALKPGEGTDDTAMALLLAESLLEKGFDPLDQMNRYLRWYQEGYLSPKGYAFGVGETTRKSLLAFAQTQEPFSGPPEGAGNGGLVRLAPLAMAYAKRPELLGYARLATRTTHVHPAALDSSLVLAWPIAEALKGTPKEALLAMEPLRTLLLHPDVAEVVGGSFLRRAEAKGYAPRTLEAALYAFAHTPSFAEGMEFAVNLGEDADSVGAAYGQLAGAFYGKESIPQAWLQPLHLRERIQALALGLYRMSMASPKE